MNRNLHVVYNSITCHSLLEIEHVYSLGQSSLSYQSYIYKARLCFGGIQACGRMVIRARCGRSRSVAPVVVLSKSAARKMEQLELCQVHNYLCVLSDWKTTN